MDNYLELIFEFMKDAGKVALNCQTDLLKSSVKEDKSIVTETDIEISRMFREKMKDILALSNHILLDEENLVSREELFNSKHEYIWTIDPIDGTTTYYYCLPTWAIAISLYKNKKPYLGVIYMPVLRELIYTDGKNSYLLTEVFTENETKTLLKPKVKNLNSKSVIMQHRLKNYNDKQFTFLDYYSAYVLAFYTITSRSCGTFLNAPAKLWDIIATLPIAKNAGLVLKSITTDETIDELKEELFDKDWKLKDIYLLTTKENFDEIASSVKTD